jgi:uncharacterized metal-binding protein (TIGR02443 family)
MPRRFIAGAVCPRCGLQDKLVVDTEAGSRECVSCGFSDRRPVAGVAEPRTRVTRAAARRLDTPAEVVTLVPDTPADRGATPPGDEEEGS